MKQSIQESYERWKAKNPGVIDLFDRFAMEASGRRKRVGVKLLAERVRGEVNITINRTGEVFRINNNYTSRIARDLITRHPEMDGVIETRCLRSA